MRGRKSARSRDGQRHPGRLRTRSVERQGAPGAAWSSGVGHLREPCRQIPGGWGGRISRLRPLANRYRTVVGVGIYTVEGKDRLSVGAVFSKTRATLKQNMIELTGTTRRPLANATERTRPSGDDALYYSRHRSTDSRWMEARSTEPGKCFRRFRSQGIVTAVIQSVWNERTQPSTCTTPGKRSVALAVNERTDRAAAALCSRTLRLSSAAQEK